jgi:hypothetical protein
MNVNKRTMMVLKQPQQYSNPRNPLLIVRFIFWHAICLTLIVFMLNDIYVVFWQQDNLSKYIEGN